MTRTEALINAAVRALRANSELLDSLPDSITSVQLDIKVTKESLPFSVHVSPRWTQSMAMSSVGAPCDIDRYKFPE